VISRRFQTCAGGRIGSTFPCESTSWYSRRLLLGRPVGTGIRAGGLAQQFAAGGYIGRASGRDFDARRTPGYAPYERLQFEIPVVHAGDVNARIWIRILEVEQSLGLFESPECDERFDVVEDETRGARLADSAGLDVLDDGTQLAVRGFGVPQGELEHPDRRGGRHRRHHPSPLPGLRQGPLCIGPPSLPVPQ